MRRQLNILVVSVTALVVVAFVLPLILLVRREADQVARLTAEREAQAVAGALVRSIDFEGGIHVDEAVALLGEIPDDLSVLAGGERVVGDLEPLQWLADLAIAEAQAQSTYSGRGWELALPVVTRAGPIVVYTLVPDQELARGVGRAWWLLGLLGIGLILAVLLVADGMGRGVVVPSKRIAEAALRLGSGDLDVRVAEEGPPELRRVAAAFNTLAHRLRELLAAEREAIADLSHQLRTPLTALRLEAESIEDPGKRAAMMGHAERLGQAIDELIAQARGNPGSGGERCDIAEVIRSRAGFWELLAEEQGRDFEITLPSHPCLAAVREAEAAAAVDALVDNVFTHTRSGVAFRLTVACDTGEVRVRVEDAGEGFGTGGDPTLRGASGAGSSGLGLDIARRLAERTGGRLRVGRSAMGGAMVEMVFKLLPDPAAPIAATR